MAKKYIARYPKSATSEFPKSGECAKLFTKERLCSKLKRIQSGFKKAIDSGRGGGGRIVTTFYEEFSAIWGGSPTVECTKNGIESCRQQEVEEQGTSTPAPDTSNLINTQDSETEDLLEENEKKNDEGRRSLLKFLHDKRDSKLTKKVGADVQLMAIAKEELMLKRKVAENMEESEKKHQKTMDSFATSLTALTKTINSGFTMLGKLLNQANEVHTTPIRHSHDSLYNFHQPANFNQFQMLDNYEDTLHPVSSTKVRKLTDF